MKAVFFGEEHMQKMTASKRVLPETNAISESKIVAAILASGLAPSLRKEGQSFRVAAEKAVELYQAILSALQDAPKAASEPVREQVPAPI
jgi:hypothetical protein